MKKRAEKILEILSGAERVEVTALAAALGVSGVTVRKDLDALEERGLIKREHGFAVLESVDNIAGRLAYHYEEKRRIAAAAAAHVHDGETVMIESGSSCALLAEILAQKKRGVTIVTNSAFIAGYVRRLHAQVILLGGVYQSASEACVGPLVAQCAKNFLVDRLFLGLDGYDSRIGFMGRDHLRAQAIRDMAAQAEEAVILTESEKFRTHGIAALSLTSQRQRVITDENIPREIREDLTGKGIIVEIAGDLNT